MDQVRRVAEAKPATVQPWAEPRVGGRVYPAQKNALLFAWQVVLF
jgi:hypothetical protein